MAAAVGPKAAGFERTVTSSWVPPAIEELCVYSRGQRWLCLNPSVPSWIVTTHAGVLLLELVDGERTVDEIVELLYHGEVPCDPVHVFAFFDEARERKLFDAPAQNPESIWQERKLEAMHLHLTDLCNLECSYCLRESSPRLRIEHRPSRFVDMLGFIKQFSAEGLRVTFAGGEPLAYPGFDEVVEASTQLGYANELLTNGTLIDRRRAGFLGKHFRRVRISLDGATARTHAATRGDNFKRVLDGIERMAETGVHLTVQMTVTRSNLHETRELHEVLPDGVRLAFTPLLPFGRACSSSSEFISDAEFLEVSRYASTLERERPEAMYTTGRGSRSCHAGLTNLSIADTGDAYPCHLFHEDSFHLGNIFHDAFEDIFYGQKIRAYVESMDVDSNNSICASCEMRYLCSGGCKANTLHATGDHRGVDLYCSFIKNSILENLFESVEAS